MSAGNFNLDLVRGDSLILDLAIKDTLGAVVDITGATIWFTAKENFEQADEDAFIQGSTLTGEIVLTNPVLGEAQVSIPASVTDSIDECPTLAEVSYVYDIQMKTALNEIFTVVRGTLRVFKDVTRSI